MKVTAAEYFLTQLKLPRPESHKGQNGKLLLIGGSQLFHAASKWSLDIASRCVDMVFYASIPSNNQLIYEAKGNFWNGIVIERTDIENYIEEADVILIGPGMTRTDPTQTSLRQATGTNNNWTPSVARKYWTSQQMSDEDWQGDTEKIINYLTAKYPAKKWVIDAGALQMMDPTLMTNTMIITPHRTELRRVLDNSITLSGYELTTDTEVLPAQLAEISRSLQSCCIVFKGATDIVVQDKTMVVIAGGHPGMTKGGTGDVLSGLIAGLAATNELVVSAVVGSYVNKKAGEELAEQVGPFFNASDLVEQLPKVLWRTIKPE